MARPNKTPAHNVKAPTINAVLDERGTRYGEFPDHARISQQLVDVMRMTPGWMRLSYAHREALEMVAHKQARILNGDANYADSWTDIAGYAVLGERACRADSK
jgi:hypothetical protein